MFERFTDRARRVLVLAQEEASLLNHDVVGTEHILLGLIHEGDGVAARALESLGVTLGAVRARVEEITGPTDREEAGSPPFTPRAKKVLELSLREALLHGHNYIDTEHMLLGLVREGEGVGAQVLVSLGADLSRVRQRVSELWAESPRTSGEARTQPSKVSGLAAAGVGRRPTPVGEVCSLCGRDLWEVERYIAAGTVRLCERCVAAAGDVIKAAESEGRGPALRLPPRVFGEAPDEHAVGEIVTAFEQTLASDPELARRLEDCWVERIRFNGSDRVRVRFGLRLISGVTFPVEGTAGRDDGHWAASTETRAKVFQRLGIDLPPAPD